MEIGSRVEYVGIEVVDALPGERGTVIGVRTRSWGPSFYQARWDGGSESWHWPAALREVSEEESVGLLVRELERLGAPERWAAVESSTVWVHALLANGAIASRRYRALHGGALVAVGEEGRS